MIKIMKGMTYEDVDQLFWVGQDVLVWPLGVEAGSQMEVSRTFVLDGKRAPTERMPQRG